MYEYSIFFINIVFKQTKRYAPTVDFRTKTTNSK